MQTRGLRAVDWVSVTPGQVIVVAGIVPRVLTKGPGATGGLGCALLEIPGRVDSLQVLTGFVKCGALVLNLARTAFEKLFDSFDWRLGTLGRFGRFSVWIHLCV